jgi:hypothetical protein
MGKDWSWEKGGAYINVPVVIKLRRKPKAKKKPAPRKKSTVVKSRPDREGQ